MKTTIEMPDDLYRRVKARAALLGRPVRAVAEELFRRWLIEGSPSGAEAAAEAESWLDRWTRLADDALPAGQAGPTARERLREDRDRLAGAPDDAGR